MTDSVYLGNPNLKKANTPIEFSEDQIIENKIVKKIRNHSRRLTSLSWHFTDIESIIMEIIN